MPATSPTVIQALKFDVHSITSAMQEGDELAFRLFYEQYCDRLFRYLLVMTRGHEDLSRELLQITMTKVVRSIKPFDCESSLWAWLTVIARHSFCDAVRKSARSPKVVSLISDGDYVGGNIPDADYEESLHEALDASLDKLEATELDLVHRFYYLEENHRSVAGQMNTTVKAVESKMARIRQKLRQAILRFIKYEQS
jgi:RNA polymerase sigma factor (sigma-70 family)